MTAEVSLNPDGEAAWLRLKQHLEWCDNFALVFLFSDRSGVIDVLRERLAAIYRARVTGLKIPLPETPDELLTGLLPRLLDPPLYQRALNAPIWLDLTRPPPPTYRPCSSLPGKRPVSNSWSGSTSSASPCAAP